MNQGWVYRDPIRPTHAGLTVLEFYAHRYRHSSRAEWQGRIEAGQVYLNGKPTACGDRLQSGQELAYHRPPWEEPLVPLEFDVLYEDADLLVIGKPSGLPVLPGGNFLTHTLLHQLQLRYPKLTPVPVHRLGRWTSGLMLLARSPLARSVLSRQLRESTAAAFAPGTAEGHRLEQPKPPGQALGLDGRQHSPRSGDMAVSGCNPFPTTIRKTYRALIGASDLPDTFILTTPIGPVAHPVLGYVYGASPTGLPAYSEGQVLRRTPTCTLVEVTIRTGRPHQIRIHLAAAGYPLLGDPLYGVGGQPIVPTAATVGTIPVPGDGGYCLHAYQLVLPHPRTQRRMEWVQPCPWPDKAG